MCRLFCVPLRCRVLLSSAIAGVGDTFCCPRSLSLGCWGLPVLFAIPISPSLVSSREPGQGAGDNLFPAGIRTGGGLICWTLASTANKQQSQREVMVAITGESGEPR